MTQHKHQEVLKTVSTEEKLVYEGMYQAYAWHQGSTNSIVEFRIPSTVDDHLVVGTAWVKFDLAKFMAVVADFDDEGSIHYWKHFMRDGDDYLALGCTEDDSMDHIGFAQDTDFAHSSHDSWYEGR